MTRDELSKWLGIPGDEIPDHVVEGMADVAAPLDDDIEAQEFTFDAFLYATRAVAPGESNRVREAATLRVVDDRL